PGVRESTRLRPRAATTATALAQRTNGLPGEVLVDAARRLGYAGLAFSFGFAVQLVLLLVFQRLHRVEAARQPARLISSVAGLALSVAVFVIARRGRLTRSQFIGIGLAYEVLGGLIIVIPDLPHVVSEAAHGVISASWLAAWIAAFTGLIP